MNLVRAFRVSRTCITAFVGAGGKTTAMFQLARELAPPVLVTATTHLGTWQVALADHHILTNKQELTALVEQNLPAVTLVTGPIEGGRTCPIDEQELLYLREVIKNLSLPLLIEADGSRQRPLKAPAEHEPAIPAFVECVVVVAGLSGLNKPLNDDNVHRSELFSRLSGLSVDQPVSPEALSRVLTHSKGGLKNLPETARRIALLSQANTPELLAVAKRLARQLLPYYNAALVATSTTQANQLGLTIQAAYEPIAGIVLAAGESTRFGGPKQLLDWNGHPFVRVVAQTALQAGLQPVTVVTGAYAPEVDTTIRDLPVQVVHNPAWQSGQASSIQAGLAAQDETKIGGTVFLLADQPQVPAAAIRALVDEHAHTLAPVIAPLVIDRRANPVLFDRTTFHDLMALEGDVGGRGIFSKHKVHYLPWHDDALLLDVDKPSDYERLKEILL